MNTDLGILSEILLLIYMIFVSVYMGWWGYVLITKRRDWIEKWWQAQPLWTQKLAHMKPIIKLPKFTETLIGIIVMAFSLFLFTISCILLVRNLLQIGK